MNGNNYHLSKIQIYKDKGVEHDSSYDTNIWIVYIQVVGDDIGGILVTFIESERSNSASLGMHCPAQLVLTV